MIWTTLQQLKSPDEGEVSNLQIEPHFDFDMMQSNPKLEEQFGMWSLGLLRNKSVLRCYQHKMNIDTVYGWKYAMIWQEILVNKKSWCNILIGILFIQTDVCELMTLPWHQYAHKNRIIFENGTATETGFDMQIPPYCILIDVWRCSDE